MTLIGALMRNLLHRRASLEEKGRTSICMAISPLIRFSVLTVVLRL